MKESELTTVPDTVSEGSKAKYREIRDEKREIQDRLTALQNTIKSGDSLVEAQAQLKELLKITQNEKNAALL
jgi:DNA repair exonuclease SbcCD ATPase subunit